MLADFMHYDARFICFCCRASLRAKPCRSLKVSISTLHNHAFFPSLSLPPTQSQRHASYHHDMSCCLSLLTVSVCTSVSVSVSVCVSVCVSVSVSASGTVSVSVPVPVNLSLSLSTYASVSLSVLTSQSLSLSIVFFFCVCVCVCVCVCLQSCLFLCFSLPAATSVAISQSHLLSQSYPRLNIKPCTVRDSACRNVFEYVGIQVLCITSQTV